MAVTPTGTLALPLACVRTLLANVTAWQEWTESVDATEAKGHVHIYELPPAEDGSGNHTLDELIALRTFCRMEIFIPPDGFGGNRWFADRSAETAYRIGGRHLLHFEANVPEEDANNPDDANIRFLNHLGAVLEGINAIAGSSEYLTPDDLNAGINPIGITRLELYAGPQRADQTERQSQGDFLRAAVLLDWGL